VLCFEIPLLFEAGLEHCFDFIVLVYATEPTRLDRLIAKGESDVNARRRIENQLDDSYKIDRVDWIIDNNGNKEQLQTAIHDLIAELHRIPKRTIAPFA
jgi:dephospho-CoA kinase